MAESALTDEEQFERELSWCITTLRKTLKKTDPSKNEVKGALTALSVLESKKAPMVKKRIAMRNALGDYRTKMAAEEESFTKKLLAGTHRLAQFDTTAQPSPEARAIHVRQPAPMSPPSAPHSSIVSSPATSSKSSTPSPIKPYTPGRCPATSPSNGSSSPPVSESVSSVDSTKDAEGSPLKSEVERPQETVGGSFAFNFDIPPENLDGAGQK